MSKKTFEFQIQNHLKFDKYFAKYNEEKYRAKAKVAIQLLTWTNQGSPNSDRVPPVWHGVLRGSGSVFVGSKFVTASPDRSGLGTPLKTWSEKDEVITVIYNTPYAKKLHERKFNPGPVSRRDSGVGHKYIEAHINADKEALMEFYAKLIKEGVR